jgi:soluble lytic murein transglycosylase-like protein
VVVAQPPPAHSGGSPPPTSPPPGATCPTYAGPVAPRADVAAAIGRATGRAYRPTLSLDDANPPAITVRLPLVQGVAWEESGWQDTIVACDGGTGTMQVMKDTADWMNLKYGTSHDFRTLDGNVSIGTGYLAWLVRYFGDKYFNGDYNLAGDPNKLVLLDLVISAYQAGYGSVDNALAKPDHTLPNLWYVYAVEGFMTNRPWASA